MKFLPVYGIKNQFYIHAKSDNSLNMSETNFFWLHGFKTHRQNYISKQFMKRGVFKIIVSSEYMNVIHHAVT